MRNLKKPTLIVLMICMFLLFLTLVYGFFWYQDRFFKSSSNSSSGGFSLNSCSDRMVDGGLALAISFTEPVSLNSNFSDLIRVFDLGTEKNAQAKTQVNGAWFKDENPRVLLFPNIVPNRNYIIEIDKGLTSVGNVAISGEQACTVLSQNMPPNYFFASKGIVLPPSRGGGLPVVTINTPEVDVQFLKVHDKSLPFFLEHIIGYKSSPKKTDAVESDTLGQAEDSGGSTNEQYGSSFSLQGRLDSYELQQLKDLSSSVYLGRFLTSAEPNRRVVTFLPTRHIKELQEPGLYIAVMNQPGEFSGEHHVTYFYVSDIGLHVRRNGSNSEILDIFTTSLKTGRALSGVNLSLLDDNGKVKLQANTDDDGRASLTGIDKNHRVLLARKNRELSLISLHEPVLDLAEYAITGREFSNNKIFIYSGRDIYRPGEVFHVSMVLRDSDAKLLEPVPLTLTLKSPSGRTYQSSTVSTHKQYLGYYQQTFTLPADAATGSWLLEARVDPASKIADSVWKFQVEEFMPERMKLALSSEKTALHSNDPWIIQAQGDYLFGAPAAGNRLLGSVMMQANYTPLKEQWPGFIFGDFDEKFEPKREALAEHILDTSGKAEVSVPVLVESKHTPLSVRSSFSLLETGGRPVVRSIERTFWPNQAFIGIRPLFDRHVVQEQSLASFELIRVKPDGTFLPLSKAKIRLVREEREFHWRQDVQRGWVSDFTVRDVLEDFREISLKDRLKISFPVKYGSYRLEIDDLELQISAKYKFYAGWYAQGSEALGNRPDRVNLKLENVPAKVSKDLRLTLDSPHDGHALIAVEGDRVLWAKRVSVTAGSSVHSIPVLPEWKRHDLYVTAMVFRAGDEDNHVTPARALGIEPLPLARDDRKLDVKLIAPSKVEPEQKIKFKVQVAGLSSAVNSKSPAFVTVSAVDVGVLNVTQFSSPNPFDFFFGKHRYSADLIDNYGKLVEYMDGRNARLKWGGDAGARSSQNMPKRVKVVDLFSGPVLLNSSGQAEITLDLPDFNGTLRLMATAISADQYGHAEQEVVVAAPVVAEISTPRFISPGDRAVVALEVTNLSGTARSIQAKLQANSPLTMQSGLQTFNLANQERKTIRFHVGANGAYGLGQLRLNLQAKDGTSVLKIDREYPLQVLPTTPLERSIRRVRLNPKESLKLDGELVKGYYQDSISASFALNTSPPLNMNSVLKGLFNYPYGCAEQTVSVAYAYLFGDEQQISIAESVNSEAVAATNLKEAREKKIAAAFSRLSGMQSLTGAFSFWGQGDQTDVWLTAYIVGFMQDARAQGFPIPKKMYESALQFLMNELQRGDFPRVVDSESRESLRKAHKRIADLAFTAYVLARDQKAPLSALRRLHDQGRIRAKSLLSLVYIGLSLKLMGDQDRAAVAFAEALKKPYGLNLDRSAFLDQWLGDYGSELRDVSLAYAALMKHQIQVQARDNLLFDALRLLSANNYLSTQERVAILLLAKAADLKKDSNWQADFKQGGNLKALTGSSSKSFAISSAELLKGGVIVNKGAAPVFVDLEVSGYSHQASTSENQYAEISRELYDMQGQLIENRALRVGEMVIARLIVKAKQSIEDGLIVDRIPAGLEIENTNLLHADRFNDLIRLQIPNLNIYGVLYDQHVRYREFRDDRFVAAARVTDKTPVEFLYMMRVVTPGVYVAPAPFLEDMYRPYIRAVGKPGKRIEVIDSVVLPTKQK